MHRYYSGGRYLAPENEPHQENITKNPVGLQVSTWQGMSTMNEWIEQIITKHHQRGWFARKHEGKHSKEWKTD